MEITEKVICPYNGIVKEVYVKKRDFVVEKDVLFEIEIYHNPEYKWIYSGIRGIVSSLDISKGEKVNSGRVIASIKNVKLP